ncbi:hypothetical protein ACPW7J_02095 [Ihubacter sp. rT4E-8]|uniref:hypothetical protein n=1 Tax=Ihubacter sp. rT4E-8 TaxID=3242369 RepID=UPI003CE92637
MEKSCENCRFEMVRADKYPCCVCSHNYTNRFEPKQKVDENKLLTLKDVSEAMERMSCIPAELWLIVLGEFVEEHHG